jgi:hypothetical protein
MKRRTRGVFLIVSLIVSSLAVPIICAEGGNGIVLPLTTPDLNVSVGAFINGTLPSRYAVTPTPIRIEVRVAETHLPAAKGEMAAGPRSIGFSFEPVSLVMLGILIAIVSAGMRYIIRRTPAQPEEKE